MIAGFDPAVTKSFGCPNIALKLRGRGNRFGPAGCSGLGMMGVGWLAHQNTITLRTVLPAFISAKPSLISESFSFAEIQSSRDSLPRM